MSEPTAEQIAAATDLRTAGHRVRNAETAWASALGGLGSAVEAAKSAGIPRSDVRHLIGSLGGATSEKLRVMLRRAYWGEK